MAASNISFDDLQLAVQKRDPAFVQLISSFLEQPAPELPDDPPEGTMSFYDFKWSVQSSWEMRCTELGDGRMEYRQNKWKAFLSQEHGKPPRLQLDNLFTDLFEQGGEWGRQILLQLISTMKLKWGPWRAIKQLYKRAEAAHDYEIVGALAVRCDYELSSGTNGDRDVTAMTLSYIRRRGWRYLRQLGTTLPSLYSGAAVNFLRWYPQIDSWNAENIWNNMWISNHIFFHEHKTKHNQKQYGRSGFNYNTHYNKEPKSLAKYRAYPDSWTSSPAPLMDLLVLCRSERVAQFAIDLLREEFKQDTRNLPLSQLIRLGQRPFGPIQHFVKELIEENPSFQKAQFKKDGLHDLLIEHFLISRDEEVRKYAIVYAQDYATDIPMNKLLQLLEKGHSDLNEFVSKQISQRDPREDLGLDGLQQLFLLPSSFELAKKLFKKAFHPSEIPKEWFSALLFSDSWDVVEYAINFLQKEYPKDKIDTEWFQGLLVDKRIENGSYSYMVRDYAQKNLQKRAGKLDPTWIKEALLHGDLSYSVREWIEQDKIKSKQLDINWLKTIVNSNDWSKSAWVAEQKSNVERWIKDLDYPYQLKSFALSILGNTNKFKPQELGLDWLLQQLQEEDDETSTFAEQLLLNHFNPTDFANPEAVNSLPEQEDSIASTATVENPFVGKSFLFTGKLKNLTRAQAAKRVTELDGNVAKSVTKKLDFLIIGDEGSPLFSGGKKGSKFIKAEEYQEQGLPVQIISETDWLQMISEGGAAQSDVDPRIAALGFECLYKLATATDQPESLRLFSIQYLKARHPILGPIQSGEALEGEQVMSRDLFSGKHFLPLFEDKRQEVQDLAIQIGTFELRRWKVPPSEIFSFCESPHKIVRRFAIRALMGIPADQDKDSKVDCYFAPEDLDSDLVFALTENRRIDVRQAGIELLSKYYALLDGDQRILRLAESPDRDVRSQAVRILWMRYRRPATSSKGWVPKKDQRSSIESGAPTASLVKQDLLLDFVRTVLFGIPPGRLPQQSEQTVRPWSNSKAKVHMIELLRDLSLEDQELYADIQPIFEQFLASHHKTESMACLVALTQLQNRWKNAA